MGRHDAGEGYLEAFTYIVLLLNKIWETDIWVKTHEESTSDLSLSFSILSWISVGVV